LSSPLFGVAGVDARRDPLGLHELLARGSTGFPLPGARTSGGAEATAQGDLLARDGTALLVELRSERDAEALLADVRDAVRELPVDVGWVGPALRRQTARELVGGRSLRVIATALAGVALVLALAFRRIRPPLAIVACLLSIAAFALAVVGPLDVIAIPLLVLLPGFACEGALALQRISVRGWPSAVVLATALAPLWLSPYPALHGWSLSWFAVVAVALLVLRLVLPAMLALLRSTVSWEHRGFLLRPMPVLAVVVSGGVLAGGAWAADTLRYRGADRPLLGDAAGSADQRRLLDEFFDPALVVETLSRGASEEAALERASLDARALARLVPSDATRVVAPGGLVLVPSELEARRAGLAALELPTRAQALREALHSRGFRPDAFGEFLRQGGDLTQLPTPAAALDGPVGGWIRKNGVPVGEGFAIRTRVHLAGDPAAEIPAVRDGEGELVELFGPAIAARLDRASFRDWLGVWVLCQLWIGAFVVWVGTRSLATAIAAAYATLVTTSAVLIAMVPMRLPVGPHMVPALLLVGGAATIAAGRACRAVDLRRPFFATGLLVTSLCQVAAALALVASGVPLWQQFGLICALGAVFASAAGLFVAPGVCRLLRRLIRRAPAGAAPGADASSDSLSQGDDEEGSR
jgi:hypothetical protein